MTHLADKITDLLADQPLMDELVVCASTAAIAIRQMPSEQREAARQRVHELIDEMLREWTPET